MIRLTLLILLSLVVTMGSLAAAPSPRVGIAATVNDDVITLGDLDNRTQLYLGGQPGQPTPAQLKALQEDVLNRLIDEKLQMQEARALSIDVADEQIAQGFAEVARQNNTTPEEFRDRLTRAGVNLNTLRDQIRSEIAWSQVVRRKLRPQVNVSEQEIDSELQQRTTKQGQAEYHIAEIFLSTEEADADDIAAEAAAMHDALKKGTRFSEIARARSQSPGAANGGDIGWLTEEQLDESLRPVISQMQVGQVSPPVKTEKGYYLIFLRDKRVDGVSATASAAAAAPTSTQPAAEPVLTLKQLTIPATPEEPRPVLAAKFARAQALATEVSGCTALDTAATEFNTQTVSGPQQLSTLPPQISEVLQGLADGALSPPVRTTNGVSVFMICKRETPTMAAVAPVAAPSANMSRGEPAPGTSNEEEVREAVAAEIGTGRLVQMQERYLRDLRATAFIERRI